MKCLDSQIQKQPYDDENPEGNKNDRLVCPLCNDNKAPVLLPSEGVKSLRTNFPFKNLANHLKMEDMVTGGSSNSKQKPALKAVHCTRCTSGEKAVSICITCHLHLCSLCDQDHKRVLQTNEHHVISLSAQASLEIATEGQAVEGGKVESSFPSDVEFSGMSHDRAWKCEEHPKHEFELYCKECDKVICLRCIVDHHRKHDYAPATEVVDEYKGKIAKMSRQTLAVQARFKQAVGKLHSARTSLEAKEKSTTEEVRQHCDGLKTELEKQRDALLKKIKAIADRKKNHLDDQLAELGRIGDTLQMSVKFSEDITENCIPVEFLFLWKQMSDRLEELCTTYGSRPCEPKEDSAMHFHRGEDLEAKIRKSDALGAVVSNPDPEGFTVDGIENQHFAEKKKSTFTITCRDIAGNALSELKVKAEIQVEKGGNIAQCQVVSNQNGTFSITINPQTHGLHQIVVSAVIGDKTFPIGPLRIVVSPAHRCDITGPTQVFGKEAASEKKMKNPWGIAVIKEENIVVSDVDMHSLLVFNKEGKYLRKIGTNGIGRVEFKSPRGLACTPDHHIIVAEKGNHRLQEVTLEGEFVRFFGTNEVGRPGSGNGQFNGPSCVAVNSEGIVYATDSQNDRIQYFKPNGEFLGIIGKSGHEVLKDPYGISIYSQPQVQGGERELVFVTERSQNRIRCFEKKGGSYVTVKTFGEGGAGKGQLVQPVGVLADQRTGYVVVAEFQNQRISIFSWSGEYMYSFGERGSDTRAVHFHNPMSIAALGKSHIIVTDCGNGRLKTFPIT